MYIYTHFWSPGGHGSSSVHDLNLADRPCARPAGQLDQISSKHLKTSSAAGRYDEGYWWDMRDKSDIISCITNTTFFAG